MKICVILFLSQGTFWDTNFSGVWGGRGLYLLTAEFDDAENIY
jgi:hypothetical protein